MIRLAREKKKQKKRIKKRGCGCGLKGSKRHAERHQAVRGNRARKNSGRERKTL